MRNHTSPLTFARALDAHYAAPARWQSTPAAPRRPTATGALVARPRPRRTAPHLGRAPTLMTIPRPADLSGGRRAPRAPARAVPGVPRPCSRPDQAGEQLRVAVLESFWS